MVVADHYNTPRAEWLVMAAIALKKVPKKVEGQCFTDGWLCPVPDISGYYIYPDKPGNVLVPMWNGHAPIMLGNLAGECPLIHDISIEPSQAHWHVNFTNGWLKCLIHDYHQTFLYLKQGNSVARDLPRTGSETNTTIFVIYILDIDSHCPL